MIPVPHPAAVVPDGRAVPPPPRRARAVSGDHKRVVPEDRARAVAVLALTLRAEAGDRPVRALEALAAAAMNRLAVGDRRWGGNLEAVCRAPFGFRCWNPRHPRHAALRAPRDAAGAALAERCRRIALRAASGTLPDPTGGATHWHEEDSQPGWSLGLIPTAELGGLLFYRPDPVPPPPAANG